MPPPVQPHLLVPGRQGHLSAAAASAYAARAAAPALKLVPPATPEAPSGVKAAQRHRASVVCEDKGSYQCGCGKVFTATVSTEVECPACGGTQAW